MTLLSVRQDVVKRMESHFTWQGPSRSAFAVCEARCCEQHGKSSHFTLLFVRQDVVTSMESHFTWQGLSRSDFQHGTSFHLAGAKQK